MPQLDLGSSFMVVLVSSVLLVFIVYIVWVIELSGYC